MYWLIIPPTIFALVSALGPQILAYKKVSPLTYHKFIKRLSLFFVGYIISVLLIISFLFNEPYKNSPHDVAIILGILTSLFPVFSANWLRLYNCDFRMFGPSKVHELFLNEKLQLNDYKKILVSKVKLYNMILVAGTLGSLIALFYQVGHQNISLAILTCLVPLLLGLIVLFLVVRLLMHPQKSSPEPELFDLLKREVQQIAKAMQVPSPTVQLHSGMLTVPYNCLATPKGLFVSLPLVKDFPADEREFVLAHELAHIKLGHIKNRQKFRALFGLIACGITILTLTNPPFHIALPIIGLSALAIFVVFALNRRGLAIQEYEADAEAIRFTRNPEALRTCLYRITSNSLFPQISEFDNPTHPSNPHRYNAAKKVHSNLGDESLDPTSSAGPLEPTSKPQPEQPLG